MSPPMSAPTPELEDDPQEQLAKLQRLRDQLKVAADHRRFNKLSFYAPYPKQAVFHDLGKMHDERCFFAGNQLGKTEAGAAEASYHATGLYPDWWLGRRIDHANRGWVGGETSVLVRDGAQKKLLGTPGVVEDFGTGYIPKHLIVDVSLARGVTDAYDTVQVRHVDGGISTIVFKSYDQGRPKWQTDTVDWVWFDEEPPEDIYSEGLARYTATRGFSFLTFTPLNGMSAVVMKFITPDKDDLGAKNRAHCFMGYDDVPWMTKEDKEKALSKYPVHERDARSKGIPMLGSGKIFSTALESLLEDALEYIPPHWVKLWGIDFGSDHPFAAVLILWDRDNDVIHVHEAFRMRHSDPRQQAARMRPIGANVPVAWPSDGNQHQRDGRQVVKLYSAEDLRMLSEHAQFENKSVSVEAGLMQLQDMMSTGRFKVARHLAEWIQEYGLYHRKDGKIVKENDDLMDATRYAFMMRRYAVAVGLGGGRWNRSRRRNGDPNDGLCKNHDYDIFSV